MPAPAMGPGTPTSFTVMKLSPETTVMPPSMPVMSAIQTPRSTSVSPTPLVTLYVRAKEQLLWGASAVPAQPSVLTGIVARILSRLSPLLRLVRVLIILTVMALVPVFVTVQVSVTLLWTPSVTDTSAGAVITKSARRLRQFCDCSRFNAYHQHSK